MENRRSKMTKQLLYEAMTDILITDHLHAVTVRRLCQMADLNRSTFYLHYETLDDFITDYTDFYMKKIWSKTKIMRTVRDYEDALSIILQNSEPYHALLKNGLYHQYILKEYAGIDTNGYQKDAFMLLSSYCVAGAEQMFLYLLEHPELSSSKKEIAESLYHMNMAGEKEIQNLSEK